MSTAKKSVIVLEVIHNEDDPQRIAYEIEHDLFNADVNIYEWRSRIASTETIVYDTSDWEDS